MYGIAEIPTSEYEWNASYVIVGTGRPQQLNKLQKNYSS